MRPALNPSWSHDFHVIRANLSRILPSKRT
jgi:hypothetical protein